MIADIADSCHTDCQVFGLNCHYQKGSQTAADHIGKRGSGECLGGCCCVHISVIQIVMWTTGEGRLFGFCSVVVCWRMSSRLVFMPNELHLHALVHFSHKCFCN